MIKTIKDLTEQQWAKIHGHRAGLEGKTKRYNPYIEGFNDTNQELNNIWESARINAKQFSGAYR